MTELVLKHEGSPVTDSIRVATKFGKRHDNVMKDIRELIDKSQNLTTSNLRALYFTQSEYVDSKGERRPYYIITEKGFSLLVMGFTGEKALAFKIEYIEAFEQARQELAASREQEQAKPKDLSTMEILQIAMESEREKLRLQEQVQVMTPKVEYVDKILQSVNNFTTTDIADELGMSAKKLNKLLCDKGIQRVHNGRYVLYAKYQGKGYTETRTHEYVSRTDGKVHTDHYTVWTEYGRVFLHSIFNDKLSWSSTNKQVPAVASA